MSDLSVTEGDWTVEYGDLLVVGDVRYQMESHNDAYLIAQAKNMYEQLKLLSELLPFLDEQTHPNIELDVIKHDIDKLLNACKPPES